MNHSAQNAPRLHRILLTGAAGGLGKVLRERLVEFADVIRLSDIAPMTPACGPSEEVIPCDLSDKAAVDALARDVDAIVHLGGISVERPFEEIIEANIRGVFHIYEAARRNGVQRVVFASSNHVIGFYKQTETIDAHALKRPDGYYGLSKSFGEDVASFYFDRYNIETVSIRIGSSFPEAQNRRMLSTWLSYNDLTALIGRALFTPNVGHTVVYGASNNKAVWWDNRHAAHLQYAPQDSSEIFREKVESQPAPAPDEPVAVYQGGAFVASGPFETLPPPAPTSACELIVDARNAVGESPFWDEVDGALYWVDIPAQTVNKWHPDQQTFSQWRGEAQIGCIARYGKTDFVAGMETGLFRLTPQADGTLAQTRLAAVDHAHAGMRFNDGRCDRQGRFWAGTMVADMSQGVAAGALYRLDAGHDSAQALAPQLTGFIVPNGLAFSPDGRTMYVSDSHPSVQKIWAFDYDTETGTPSNRRLFVDMNQYPGRPDGAAVDAHGYYWICGNDEGVIHRFSPEGELERSLPVPVKKPAMCAFGGVDRDVLYVTSIRPAHIDLTDQPLAGGLFALHPGIAGLPETPFGT